MDKYYRINKVVQLTSVSIRTLHYYDEIKLLCPSHKTDGGHRLYSKDDLMKLQQIMTLKFMGFPLREIQNLLQGSHFNIHESLKIQAGVFKKEAARIKIVSKLLDHLVDDINDRNTIDWESIIEIIKILQLSELDKQTWYEKFLNEDELEEMKHLFSGFTDEFWTDYHKRWADLFEEVRQNLNTNPESETGIFLAQKWMALVNEVYASKPELSKKLWDGYKAGIIPENQLSYDQSIIAYITKACKKLNLTN
jgi:DNA-binding transcriptional MerR regulator